MTAQQHEHPSNGHANHAIPATPAVSPGHAGHAAQAGHAGHGWMMIACCIPMIVIAVALVATGVVNSGFLVVAALCVGMMALMMRGMDHEPSGEVGQTGHGGHGGR